MKCPKKMLKMFNKEKIDFFLKIKKIFTKKCHDLKDALEKNIKKENIL